MKMKSKPKIVMVGGGSYAWAPNLVKDMMMSEEIAGAEFVLLDIDLAAAELVETVLLRVEEKIRSGCTFRSTTDRSAALKNADYIIIAISTGDLDAMEHDIAIPEDYGIYHTVGDTSGPGGWARFFRNYAVFAELAADINRLAPKALVMNYTNPMTTLTDVLARLCRAPVIGLCHGLFENLAFIQELYKLDEKDISVRYAGLNHFFWITDIHAGGRDLLADLHRKLKRKGFTDLLRESSPDPMGFKSNRELATQLYRETGVFPYLGDRHTCEFFPAYITKKGTLREYKLIRTSIEERRKRKADRKQELQAACSGPLPESFTVRSRETAADIISAHLSGKPFIDVGNVPNIGQITNLPLGTVVETPVCIDASGITPLACGALPETVLPLVQPYAEVFNLSVKAAMTNDRELALHALRLDPVCAHLTPPRVREMGTRLLEAHKAFCTI